MFCTNCGLELRDADRFCAQCGISTGAGPEVRNQGYYAPRKVYRLMYDKKIAGVCSGLAKYFEMDVTLMRILVLCVALCTGVGFLGYLFAWIVMPKDYGPVRPGPAPYSQPQTAS